jgi:ATP-dependent RNA helicase HelY
VAGLAQANTMTTPDTTSRHDILAQFAALYPFPLDAFQIEAIQTFIDGSSVMVAAPTGTGKTIVAEFGVYDAFRRQGRVIYTTPIKALSNQKFRDLRSYYGRDVGLLTGDITENSDAPILVMTTEVLRNMLIQTPWDLDAVDCVIFDEVHYLADPERGTTWEEAIILCPEHIQLICLSATVSNADEIAAWISRTHRPIRLITHPERAIPLSLEYFLDKKLRTVIDHTGEIVATFPDVGGEIHRRARRAVLTPEERAQAEVEEPQPWQIIQAMSAKDMLPAIYFLFSRRDCEEFAQRLAIMRPNLVRDDETRQRIQEVIDHHLGSMREEDRQLQQVAAISGLAVQGIGFHHAGLLPLLKQLVEVLFSRGLMQVVFATDTLALGVNMPARSVVIGRLSKWDGRRRRPLITNEFQQMAGRAGRRGMDPKGNIIVPYSPWVSFLEMLKIATGELEPVMSSFSVRYNTVLNLWDPPHGNRVRHMLQQSLAQFQSARRARDLEDDIVGLGERILEIPQGCLIGLDAGDELLDEYQNLNHSINALKGKVRTLDQEMTNLNQRVESRPWPEPGRQALRKLFLTARPGLVVHTRKDGWGVWLGRPAQGGIGLFLFGNSVKPLTQYRDIDYPPSRDLVIDVPEELTSLSGPVADVTTIVGSEATAALQGRIQSLPLPDLDAMILANREKLQAQLERVHNRVVQEGRDARQLLTDTTTLRDGHPCHTCPRRKEHQNNLRRVEVLEQERSRTEQALDREMERESERIRGLIRGIRNVLHRFDYLHRGYPTAKTDLLADVFDNNGLIICEMIDRGLLERLSPADIAEVFSWYAFDRDARLRNTYTLPNRLVLLRRRLDELEQQVVACERGNGLFISSGHHPTYYGGMRAWCNGSPMASITERIDLSEGDLVLNFNKTIDLMRQVREMLVAAMPDHPLREKLAEAERLVKRGIVEQSLTLGIMPVAEAGAGTGSLPVVLPREPVDGVAAAVGQALDHDVVGDAGHGELAPDQVEAEPAVEVERMRLRVEDDVVR